MSTRERSRWAAFGFVLAAVVPLGVLPLAAQESERAGVADAPARKVADVSRRVPPFFGQVGLTPEQKEEIYKIRGKHLPQIEALQKQVAEEQARMMAECESVLNESQKSLLTTRREAAARARALRTTAPKVTSSSKAGEKSSN